MPLTQRGQKAADYRHALKELEDALKSVRTLTRQARKARGEFKNVDFMSSNYANFEDIDQVALRRQTVSVRKARQAMDLYITGYDEGHEHGVQETRQAFVVPEDEAKRIIAAKGKGSKVHVNINAPVLQASYVGVGAVVRAASSYDVEWPNPMPSRQSRERDIFKEET